MALIIHYLSPSLSVGLIYSPANVPLFIAGWFFISGRFFIYSIAGALIFSGAIGGGYRFGPGQAARRPPGRSYHGSGDRDHPEQVSTRILSEIRRGATILHGQGGYSEQEQRILYTVVSFQEIASLKRVVRTEDPDAFVVVSDTTEVMGHRIGNQPHW